MRIPLSLRAREPRAAARIAAIVLLVCAGMLSIVGIVGIVGPATAGDAGPGIIWSCVAGLLVVAGVLDRVPPNVLDRAGAFLALAIGGVTVLATLAILGGGTSTRTQAFLAFVVVYAGSHLRPTAAVIATAYSVAAGGAMLFHAAETARAAVSEWVFFGAMLGVIGGLLIRSTSRQERLVAALKQQVDVDALTGLVTRRVLDEALARALSGTTNTEGTALLLMDVDEFKCINDVHGHLAGDDALVHLATILKRQTRSTDAVVSRMGGDEVAILLRRCSRETAVRRAQQLLDAVRGEPLTLPDGTLYGLSISLGVAHAERSSGDLRALYAAADDALYAAKRGGRGRVEVAVA